ncbi:DNA/RNA nuclease SfsA [uncultured Clostridium sp.]|uniref:DNA/RNA nuclease SfsA n=1 Tax=uncultured Clostridium sp. TaxID=59620 RepID=UPI0025F5883A|nr:DNA/RNA nuclease SfsA [uncultured Clostridium sp.]
MLGVAECRLCRHSEISDFTESKQVIFPSVFSKRAIEQLKILLELMKEGKKVTYIYVSLSPTVEQIFINEDDIEYYTLLKECVKNGMQLIGLRSYFQNEEIVICENVSIHFN